MQTPLVLSLCLIVLGSAAGQQPLADRAPIGIEILKVKWSLETPLFQDWDKPAFSASDTRGHDPEPHPPLRPVPIGPFVYRYSMKVKNAGMKAISAVAWEYRFLDRATNRELAKEAFRTYTRVGAGKTVTLRGSAGSPPSEVLRAVTIREDKPLPFIEGAVITCVMYIDGTLEKGSTANDTDCESLKAKGDPRKK